jgi:patatin-related protein
MLHMVRSTAVREHDRLSAVESVYRKLACIIGQGKPQEGTEADPGALDDAISLHCDWADDGRLLPLADQPRTKFVIDILSGTSAGGINAIYLAKALANHESLAQLARMWLDVADIKKLLNDRESAEYPVQPQDPPASLLNSRWMYLKLLEALDGMSEQTGGAEPLVEDLDLFSTATDLDGIALPIALADRQVVEFRHCNVFRFRKRNDSRNDFTQDANPFLAFAARCTSAFPFAFEPMALCDIFDLVRHRPAHKGKPYCAEDTDHWQKFYLEYIRDVDPHLSTEFRFRSFGDGGYLDNKPFSYAIDAVMTRRPGRPVDRKLIYVEPSPEDVGKVAKKRRNGGDRPNAIENSLAALVELPRYETIRQDLERVLEWNRNVRRIKRMIASAQRPLETISDPALYKQGPAYQFYLRLRRSAVTDSVSDRVAEAMRLDPRSALGEAIRGLAGAWRSRHIHAEEEKAAFLQAYDVEYLERAVHFLFSRLREASARALARKEPPGAALDIANQQCVDIAEAQKLLRRLADAELPSVGGNGGVADEAVQRADLEFLVNPLAAAERSERFPNDPMVPDEALGATAAAYAVRARYLLDLRWDALIEQAESALRGHFAGRLQRIRALLEPVMEAHGGWDRFDIQDSLVFPVTFGTSLGEVDPIDVIRISPADAARIAGVNDDGSSSEPALKGEKLGAFGGFLDRRWRLHDMLCGRLHAAERLITAVLPDCDPRTVKIREALVKEAQEAIAVEWEAEYGQIVEEEEKEYAAARSR